MDMKTILLLAHKPLLCLFLLSGLILFFVPALCLVALLALMCSPKG